MKVKDVLEVMQAANPEMDFVVAAGDNVMYDIDVYEQELPVLGWCLTFEGTDFHENAETQRAD